MTKVKTGPGEEDFIESTTFDQIEFDEHARGIQDHFKGICIGIEHDIKNGVRDSVHKRWALGKLEELYTLINKSIKADQLARELDETIKKAQEEARKGE